MKHLRIREEAFENFRSDPLDHMDFCFGCESDLLALPTFVCESGALERQTCGCGRSFTSVQNSKASTIGVVEDMNEYDLRREFQESPHAASWSEAGISRDILFEELIGTLSKSLEKFAVGDAVRINHGKGEFILYPADQPILDQI